MKNFTLTGIALILYSLALVGLVHSPTIITIGATLATLSGLLTLIWRTEHYVPANHDLKLFDEFKNTFPSDGRGFAFLRDHDTAGSWFPDQTRDIQSFVTQWADAEHDFIDRSLRKQKTKLLNLTTTFWHKLTEYSWREGDYCKLCEATEPIPQDIWDKIKELNDLGSDVAKAHQQFVRKATRKLKQ